MDRTDCIKSKRTKRIAYCTYHSCIITAGMAKKHGCNTQKPRCKHFILIFGKKKDKV